MTFASFLNHFQLKAEYSPTGYLIIIHNIPISFNIHQGQINGTIAYKNHLAADAIVSCRWMKPEHQWSPAQSSAHHLLGINTADNANALIRGGVKVVHHKAPAMKLLMEPRHCAKCQAYDGLHFAKDCPLKHDTCAKCAGQHRSISCKVTNPLFFKCANCNEPGHTAYNKACPSFKNIITLYNKIYPGNRFIYFPTLDPWTWQKIGDPIPAPHVHKLPTHPDVPTAVPPFQTASTLLAEQMNRANTTSIPQHDVSRSRPPPPVSAREHPNTGGNAAREVPTPLSSSNLTTSTAVPPNSGIQTQSLPGTKPSTRH